MADWPKTRSKIAHAIKANPNADVSDLRAQLKAERLEEYIERVVNTAPPLSASQRDKLALLLRGGDQVA